MEKRSLISGFTLIELMITIVVLSVLAVLAAPSYYDLIDRYRLKSAAESLQAFMQFARIESIKRNEIVRVDFNRTSASVWCYGIKINAACDCTITDPTDAAYCELDDTGKVISSSDYPGIKIPAAVSFAGSVDYTSFNPYTGFATDTGGSPRNGTVNFESDRGKKLDIIVGTIGRVRMCTPDDSVLGYPTC